MRGQDPVHRVAGHNGPPGPGGRGRGRVLLANGLQAQAQGRRTPAPPDRLPQPPLHDPRTHFVAHSRLPVLVRCCYL